MPLMTFWRVTMRAMWGWWHDNCLRLAASLAFYTALSLAPLVVIVVGLAGLVTERQQVAQHLATESERLLGSAGRQVVEVILTTTGPQGGTLATLTGLLTLLLGATAVFGELAAALNLIWEVQPKPLSGVGSALGDWLKQRVFSLAIVLAIAFLLLVSLFVSAALAGAATYLRGLGETSWSRGRVLELALSLPVLMGLFALLFKYVPDVRLHWRDVWVGGGITAILFTIGKAVIGAYIGHAGVGTAYGAAGSLVALLVWVYYSALIVFFGAEFTQAWTTRQRIVQPELYAEPGVAPQTKRDAAAEDIESGDAVLPDARGGPILMKRS
jgi:membrane protein